MDTPIAIGVVEDSDDDFAIFKRVAGPLAQITRWTSGEQALNALDATGQLRELRLLFVDCHLPGIDGIDLVRRLRQAPGGQDAKIVMISGSQSQGVAGRAINAGVDRFERKGGTLAELRDAIRRAFDLVDAGTGHATHLVR